MENKAIDQRKYPIGPFAKKEHYSEKEINAMISIIEETSDRYNSLEKRLKPEDLEKTYRPGSWNVKQLIHHVADIQLLHFLRMKKALTEPDYTEVTLIDMDGWANTPDGKDEPVTDSLEMLQGTTKRYAYLLRSLDENQLKITYFHPVRKYQINQAQAIAMSAWHLQHHLAHLELAIG